MVYQRNDKDCLQAVLSILLDIEYDSVPKFYEDIDTWFEKYDEWLNRMGMYRIYFDVRYDGRVLLPFDCGIKEFECIGILKKVCKEYCHAVLLKFKKNDSGYEISMYDVKRDSEYLIDDIVQIEFIVKRI